jgi:hypothetical protein
MSEKLFQSLEFKKSHPLARSGSFFRHQDPAFQSAAHSQACRRGTGASTRQQIFEIEQSAFFSSISCFTAYEF